MTGEPTRVLGRGGNVAVTQLDGGAIPGIHVQGDTFAGLQMHAKISGRGSTGPAVAMFRYTFAADILGRVESPLREPTFLMLAALAGEPMHGYGLIAEVARLSDGRISLRPGTLYGALDRLVDAGLVGVDHEEIVEGRLRRYYRLTEPGGEVLAAETERMRRNVKAATARLRAAKAAPRLSRGLA